MSCTVAGLALVEREEAHGRTRLALVDDAGTSPVDACWLTIDPLRLHDGTGGTVELLGIGNVNTLPDHRRRGLASGLLEAAVERMRGSGAAGSLLYGIDDFYDRFGWRTWGDERWVDVPVDRLGAPGSTYAVRPMLEADGTAIRERYATIAARVPGADARSSGRAWAQLRPTDVDVALRDGELVGWAWLGAGAVPERDAHQERRGPEALVFAELQAVEDEAMEAVLSAAAARARAAGSAWIVTGAPEEHPLRSVARHGALECRLVDEVRPRGGAMLLPFDASARALAARQPYQFLPDRF